MGSMILNETLWNQMI